MRQLGSLFLHCYGTTFGADRDARVDRSAVDDKGGRWVSACPSQRPLAFLAVERVLSVSNSGNSTQPYVSQKGYKPAIAVRPRRTLRSPRTPTPPWTPSLLRRMMHAPDCGRHILAAVLLLHDRHGHTLSDRPSYRRRIERHAVAIGHGRNTSAVDCLAGPT